MQTFFTYPPSVYRADSEHTSRFLSLWLPIICVVCMAILAMWHPTFFFKWLFNERTGFAEFIHTLFPLLTALIALRLLFFKFIRTDPFLIIWCSALLIGGIYLSGEEASWGQHYIGWTTPEYWSNVNDQQETNLHNVSHWFDQKPRWLLVIGIFLSCTIWPYFLLNKPEILPRRFDFTYPPLSLLIVGFIVVLCEIYMQSRVLLPDALSNIPRPGEFQETFIVWYLFGYALCLLKRAKSTVEPS